ncbi:MAG: hypothetical protein MJK13_01915 [Pseudomonadales bacterium]|nr:hypothetical protein [Pseudomonadales bacterium]MCJ8337075.1 hypothetical protein [Pseudomonadales bacterium]NRA14505.1 hypothetical protein [Oceanospirillaceae bacterium]
MNQTEKLQNNSLDCEIKGAANSLQDICHSLASERGWWKDPKTGQQIERNRAELLMLCVSELAEAMEADRKDLNDDHLPHRKGFEVELADCLIRIFDIAGAYNLDLSGAMLEKLKYNSQRADHRPENRAEGGKKY